MRSDAVADSGFYAPRHFCDFRVRVQVNKIQRTLSAAGGEGVGNLLAHAPAPSVDSGVTQVDAVTNLCQLVAGFVAHLIGTPTSYNRFSSEAARIGRQRTA